MRNTIRHCAITLALAAMVLRALLPTGWMPNPAGFAGSPFAICRMDASVPVQTDMEKDGHGGHPGGHDQQQNNETCPFAAAPHLAPASFCEPISEPALACAASSPFKHNHSETDSARYSPQSPRAPPSFA